MKLHIFFKEAYLCDCNNWLYNYDIFLDFGLKQFNLKLFLKLSSQFHIVRHVRKEK